MMQNILRLIALALCAEMVVGQSMPVGSGRPAQREQMGHAVPAQLAQIAALLRLASRSLPREDSRVVFASETSLDSLHLERWIVTIEHKPKQHDMSKVIESGPPCMDPQVVNEACSIRELASDPQFRGAFEVSKQVNHFSGRVTATAKKFMDFRTQLRSHPEWNKTQIVAALKSAGAKYPPDEKEEFLKALPLGSLKEIFGPMKLKEVASVKPGKSWPTYWKVRTTMTNSPSNGLVMYFDPFEGELQLLYSTGPYQDWDPVAKKFKWRPAQE